MTVLLYPVERCHKAMHGARYRVRGLSCVPRPALLGASCVALLFVTIKLAIVRTATAGTALQWLLARRRAEAWTLGVLAALAGVAYSFDMAWRQPSGHGNRSDRDSRAAENAAVARVCHAVILEIAQPLTGIIAYSELLSVGAEQGSDAQRRELDGLREGALQLEHLLQAWRAALDVPRSAPPDRDLAADIVTAVSRPRARLHRRAPARGGAGAT